ncbi:class I SAM-dependent methyltransferase [Aerosakkonema sp. BLCC-F183]|uniref:class I SAM-dependent methyltransferase n=1 Tax=Aerosakkonema sp. BLCC-F183 TaxID=3342834 RepID=UPI0035B79E7A
MNFSDHFSSHASEYAKYRPRYPEALFEYLAAITPEHKLAWDCGTGNGQVALSLTAYFQQVYGTDASEKQIAEAFGHDRIRYWVTTAERTEIPNSAIDLITVAQALHWFNFDLFYQEVRRVLKPNGVIAVWCYGFFTIHSADEQLNQALAQYYQAVEAFWPSERQLVEQKYETISFPFVELTPPSFAMSIEWNVAQVIGYLQTWSATQRFIAQHGIEQIAKMCDRLTNVWGDSQATKLISWPLSLRVGHL